MWKTKKDAFLAFFGFFRGRFVRILVASGTFASFLTMGSILSSVLKVCIAHSVSPSHVHLEIVYQLRGAQEPFNGLPQLIFCREKWIMSRVVWKPCPPRRGFCQVSSPLIKMKIIAIDTDLFGSFCWPCQICKAQPPDSTLFLRPYWRPPSVFQKTDHHYWIHR